MRSRCHGACRRSARGTTTRERGRPGMKAMTQRSHSQQSLAERKRAAIPTWQWRCFVARPALSLIESRTQRAAAAHACGATCAATRFWVSAALPGMDSPSSAVDGSVTQQHKGPAVGACSPQGIGSTFLPPISQLERYTEADNQSSSRPPSLPPFPAQCTWCVHPL